MQEKGATEEALAARKSTRVCSLAREAGDAGALGAICVQVARDELQIELPAASILPSRILILRHDLIEGAQTRVDVLHG